MASLTRGVHGPEQEEPVIAEKPHALGASQLPAATVPPPGDPSDHDLVAALGRGDVGALDQLFQRYHRLLLACARRTVDPITAEDVVSESFLKLYRVTIAGGGPSESLRSYLLATVRNTAIDTLRRRRDILVDTRDPAFHTLVDRADLAAQEAEADDELAARAALTELPDRWKTALWAIEVEGHSRHHVAQLLGISPGAVSALATRARQGLRRSYLALDRHGCPERSAHSCHDGRSTGPQSETPNRT